MSEAPVQAGRSCMRVWRPLMHGVGWLGSLKKMRRLRRWGGEGGTTEQKQV